MSTNIVAWDDRVFSIYRSLRANFEQLQKHISFNTSGQPNSFVNITELLMCNSDLNFNNIDERLFLPVIIQEGIPTVNSIPIWERIEGEPTEAYEVFKQYRMLKMNNKPRTMYNLSLLTNIPVAHLETMRHLFNWNYRVQAFDAYISAERQLMLEQYRVEIEGKHLKMANKLAEQAFSYFEENESMITPKVALQMLDWAVKLERITTGLNPAERGTINGSERIQLNVQNNVTSGGDNTSTSVTTNKTEVEQVEEDKDRLATMVNILSEIGVLTTDNSVVDVDYEEM
ncbi:MAG: hypothetical protein IJ086_03430 [Clostridium sp.]|nr:hypothetical protein [Clostridium sp.]